MSKSLKMQQLTRRPLADALEPRLMFYALSGMSWSNTDLSYSFMPDGTTTDGGDASKLFAKLNASYPTATWQREFAEALQTWANVSNLNFHLVSDDGSPQQTMGQTQGDPRFGDLRYGTREMGANVLGYAYFPNTSTYGSTGGGDVAISTSGTYYINGWPDLYSVLLHESGHALGLMHSTTGVMAGVATSPYAGLDADDIAGIQAIYGARSADAFDAAASNNTSASASTLALASDGSIGFRADLTSMSDVDYYSIVAPSNSDGKLTVSVDARGLSLLAPKLMVYDAAGNLVGSSSGQYGSVATINLSGIVPGQRYIVVADGATPDVFGMGAYKLAAQFGQGPIAPPPPAPPPPPEPTPVPAAPSNLTGAVNATSVDLSWSDNSADELGFTVQRSTDGGSTWVDVAGAGADVTTFHDSAPAGSARQYRVVAFNGAGVSASSNTVEVVVPPSAAAPPTAPTNLSVTKLAKNKLKLSWIDNASDELGYIVQRSNDGGSTWTQVAMLGADASSYLLASSGNKRGTAYSYRVVAYNDAGNSSASNVVTF